MTTSGHDGHDAAAPPAPHGAVPAASGTAAPAAHGPDAGEPTWRIYAVLLVPLFLSLMSVSIVNVALPAISTGLDASSADLQWVLAGYTLAFGVMLVAAGRAGDLWGRKPLFVAGILVFTAGCLASGLATSPLVLNIARVVTGIGSGLLNPQIIGIIQNTFHGQARGRAYGAFGTVIGLGVAVGPLVGGLLLGAFGPEWGWRLTFLVNVPVGILAVVLAAVWLHRPREDPQAPVTGRTLGALDPVGALLLAAGITAVMMPFIVPGTWYLLVPAAVLLGVWWWWERRMKVQAPQTGRAPMVDPAVFRIASFTFGTVISAAFLATMPGIWVIQAMFLQDGMGRTALEAGLATLPSAFFVIILSPVVGARVHRHGPVFMLIGSIGSILALVLTAAAFSLISVGAWPIWSIAATMSLLGISQSFIMPSNQTLAMHDVPPRQAGTAGGVMQTAQRVLTALGLSAVTGAFFASLAAHPQTSGAGREVSATDPTAYGAAAVIAMAVVGAAWLVMVGAATLDLVRRRRSGSLSLTD